MPPLPDPDKDRARWHLGYTSDAVPRGDSLILEDRMENVPTAGLVTRFQELLNRCDRTYAEAESDAQTDGTAYRRLITGDVNRTDIEYRPDDLRDRRKSYIYETDLLARRLGVRNYTNPKNQQYLHLGVVDL